MSKNRPFKTIYLLKLALLSALARESEFHCSDKNLKGRNQASQPGKPLNSEGKQVAGDVALLAL